MNLILLIIIFAVIILLISLIIFLIINKKRIKRTGKGLFDLSTPMAFITKYIEAANPFSLTRGKLNSKNIGLVQDENIDNVKGSVQVTNDESRKKTPKVIYAKEKSELEKEKKSKKKKENKKLPKNLEFNEQEKKDLIKKSKKIKNEKEKKDDKKQGGKQVMIKIISYEDLIKKIKNKELKSLVDFFKNKENSTLIKRVLEKRFESEKDINDFLKQEIINYLQRELAEIKEEISQLRKKGEDTKSFEIKLMSVPLKIKIFSANFTKKDFDKVVKILETVKKQTQKLLKSLEKNKDKENNKNLKPDEKAKKIIKKTSGNIIQNKNQKT